MASRKKTAPTKTSARKSATKKSVGSRAARRAPTDSGPAKMSGGADDPLVQQGLDVQAAAATFDHNPSKAAEYGRDNALADITVATEVDEVAILNDTTVADWARSPCATSPPSGRCCCWRPTTSAPDTSRSGA